MTLDEAREKVLAAPFAHHKAATMIEADVARRMHADMKVKPKGPKRGTITARIAEARARRAVMARTMGSAWHTILEVAFLMDSNRSTVTRDLGVLLDEGRVQRRQRVKRRYAMPSVEWRITAQKG